MFNVLRPTAIAAALAAVSLAALTLRTAHSAESATEIPPAATNPAPLTPGLQKIVVAGGCFWGVQAVFQHVKGVTSAVSGYAGGPSTAANYSAVSTGSTGHAESVEITYDPTKVSTGQLLQVYFSVAHDPTEVDRQGPDTGSQYRSEVFTTDDAQTSVTKAYIAQLDGAKRFPAKIATKVEPLRGFYPAEGYHQDYLTLHPHQPYIVFNDMPKLDALQRMFPDLYRPEPKLVASGS